MTGNWYLNGSDLYSTYGVALLKGSYLTIMSPPKPRKRLEHDYVDANGSQVDTTSPLSYEPHRYTISVVITASSYVQFWARYNAFIAAMATPGTFALYIKNLGITVNLLYEGMRCTFKPRSLRSGRVSAVYEISVFEKNPTLRSYDPN